MDLAALNQLSYGLYVAGVQSLEGGYGGCIVDAVMQVTSDEPPMLVLGSIRKNCTNESLRQFGQFSLSVLPKSVDPFVVANFGFQSARKVDKWANVAHEMMDGLPVLPGCPALLRCRVDDHRELSTHTLFFCTVLDAVMGEETPPLLYADYRNEMKNRVFEAFKAHKAAQADK